MPVVAHSLWPGGHRRTLAADRTSRTGAARSWLPHLPGPASRHRGASGDRPRGNVSRPRSGRQRAAAVGAEGARLSVRQPRSAGLPVREPERGVAPAPGLVTEAGAPTTRTRRRGAERLLAALALIFALAHIPFLATSLEDIDSVNFALGVRDFDVATHRPHPPGYPVYIALGKAATAITGVGIDAPASVVEAKALAVLSLLAGVVAIALLYRMFAALGRPGAFDVQAIAAVAIAVCCPLFWYLAVRPMSDLPGLAFAVAAQTCLMLAWSRQRPGDDGDRRLSADAMRSSGRMIVAGAFLAGLAIGVRSQTLWLTLP